MWLLGHRVNVFFQAAFQVASFVFVYDISFCKLVQHAEGFGKQAFCLAFVGCFADVFNHSTCGFMLIAIEVPLRFVRPDALDCGFMICHLT